MTGHAAGAGAAVVLALAGWTQMHASPQMPAGSPAPPQTFRAATDVVLVDVSVRDGGRAVTGLGVDDFVLADNGVRQRVESVESTAVPIDLTLVVDLSGSPSRPWEQAVSLSKTAARVNAEIADAARLLRPDDRLRVLAIDDHVRQLLPFGPVPARAITITEAGGLGSVFDALAAAVLHPVEPARRHVVVARMKGIDTISALDANAVAAIVERSDALVHVVMMEQALFHDAQLFEMQCGPVMEFTCWPTRRPWIPYWRNMIGVQRAVIGGDFTHPLLPAGQTIAAAAAATGGRLHQAAGVTEPTLVGEFRNAFDDFRSSYVLRYRPQGVARAGWHRLEVRVPKRPSYRIRARTGYAIEELAATAASSSPAGRAPGASSPTPLPRSLAELTQVYGRAEYERAISALRQIQNPERLIRQFEEDGNPWPANPRREAVFALELAEPGVFAAAPDAQTAAFRLLERFSRLVRHPLEPDAFEQLWYFGAITMLQGAIRPADALPIVTRALQRFPDEPQFVLARAIVFDVEAVRASTSNRAPTAETLEMARAHYLAAIALPESAIEARIRLAWLLHRTRRDAEALTHLTAAGASTIKDPSLRYLHQLFLGHVLSALGRPDDAASAFRGAMAVQPAQSARVALMNTLLLSGDRGAAEAQSDDIQRATVNGIDPWVMYWQGQYRVHQGVMAALRKLISRP